MRRCFSSISYVTIVEQLFPEPTLSAGSNGSVSCAQYMASARATAAAVQGRVLRQAAFLQQTHRRPALRDIVVRHANAMSIKFIGS